MLSMTDQRKSPASQPCLTHSTANRAQDMEITEDRTREQKAEDHRMADARQMTVVTDRPGQAKPAMSGNDMRKYFDSLINPNAGKETENKAPKAEEVKTETAQTAPAAQERVFKTN